jgi:hypothetical protein
LSTFQIQPLVKHQQNEQILAIIEHDDDNLIDESILKTQSSNNNNDIGYYGSSDNCSSIHLTQSTKNKSVYKQQQHRPAKYVTNKVNSLCSSLTSSSSTSPQQPIITNLYPPYSFLSNNQKLEEVPVKVYLERFERIYNSTTLNDNLNQQRNSYSGASYSYV